MFKSNAPQRAAALLYMNNDLNDHLMSDVRY